MRDKIRRLQSDAYAPYPPAASLPSRTLQQYQAAPQVQDLQGSDAEEKQYVDPAPYQQPAAQSRRQSLLR